MAAHETQINANDRRVNPCKGAGPNVSKKVNFVFYVLVTDTINMEFIPEQVNSDSPFLV